MECGKYKFSVTLSGVPVTAAALGTAAGAHARQAGRQNTVTP
jgi:hypothetical protein